MKCIKVIFFSLLVTQTMPVIAQVNAKPKKDDSRAKVKVVNGQNALVLKTGRKSQSSSWGTSYSADIVLKLDGNTWQQLDSLITAPWGSAVRMKDIDGHKVDVAKANVNSKVGLMFTAGTKCVAINEEEWNKIKQR